MIDCNDPWDMALNLSKNDGQKSEPHALGVVWNLSLKNHGSPYSFTENTPRITFPTNNSPDSTTTDEIEYACNYATASTVRCEFENEDSYVDSPNSLWLPHFKHGPSSPTLQETTQQFSRFSPYNNQQKYQLGDLREKDLPVTPRKRRKQLKPVRVINCTYVTSSCNIGEPISSGTARPLGGASLSVSTLNVTDQDELTLSALEDKPHSSPWKPATSPSVTCPYCDTAVQLANFAYHLQKSHASLSRIPTPEAGTGNLPSPSSTHSPVSLTPGPLFADTQEKGSCRIVNYEAYCKVCDKEFCNKFFLRKHTEKQHGISLNALTSPSPTSALDLSNSYESYFKAFIAPPAAPVSSLDANPPEGMYHTKSGLSLGQMQADVTGRDGNWTADDVQSFPMPVRNYCKLCDKELCNKYFLKRHMLKMHSIDLGNRSKIVGVTCDICYKELCSKYFLKVHKQNAHGICEENKS